jgi:hypothetical protein
LVFGLDLQAMQRQLGMEASHALCDVRAVVAALYGGNAAVPTCQQGARGILSGQMVVGTEAIGLHTGHASVEHHQLGILFVKGQKLLVGDMRAQCQHPIALALKQKVQAVERALRLAAVAIATGGHHVPVGMTQLAVYAVQNGGVKRALEYRHKHPHHAGLAQRQCPCR